MLNSILKETLKKAFFDRLIRLKKYVNVHGEYVEPFFAEVSLLQTACCCCNYFSNVPVTSVGKPAGGQFWSGLVGWLVLGLTAL